MTDATKTLCGVLGCFALLGMLFLWFFCLSKVDHAGWSMGPSPQACPKIGTPEPTPAKPKPPREQSEAEAFARPTLDVLDPTDADYAFFGFNRAGQEYKILDGDRNILFRFFVERCTCPQDCSTCRPKSRNDRTRCDHGGCECHKSKCCSPPAAASPEPPSFGQLAHSCDSKTASQPAKVPASVAQPRARKWRLFRPFRRGCR